MEEKILALGKFTPKDITVSVAESNRKIDRDIENKIDEIWEHTLKKAESEGKTCYNGISYRLNSLKKEGSALCIEFGLLEFKVRQVLPTIQEYFNLPEDYYRKGCYSGATVKTTDNQYLVVELSGKSMNMNTTDMLGGIIEKPLEIETSEDLFESLYTELLEEGLIKKEDIVECFLRAVFLGSNTNVGFYFEVILNLSSRDVLKKFGNNSQDQDIKSLKVLTQKEYIHFLSNHNAPSKRLIPSIITI